MEIIHTKHYKFHFCIHLTNLQAFCADSFRVCIFANQRTQNHLEKNVQKASLLECDKIAASLFYADRSIQEAARCVNGQTQQNSKTDVYIFPLNSLVRINYFR